MPSIVTINNLAWLHVYKDFGHIVKGILSPLTLYVYYWQQGADSGGDARLSALSTHVKKEDNSGLQSQSHHRMYPNSVFVVSNKNILLLEVSYSIQHNSDCENHSYHFTTHSQSQQLLYNLLQTAICRLANCHSFSETQAQVNIKMCLKPADDFRHILILQFLPVVFTVKTQAIHCLIHPNKHSRFWTTGGWVGKWSKAYCANKYILWENWNLIQEKCLNIHHFIDKNSHTQSIALYLCPI